ncbi:MAG: cytochrome P460 family protein [Pseudomonadota bacterium]
MHSAIGAGAAAVFMLGLMSTGHAGPEQIAFPQGFEDNYVRYKTLDKRDQDPDVVRMLYVDPASAAYVQPEVPLPEGSRFLLVDYLAAVDNDGSTLVDRDGRMVPSESIKQILVSEKRGEFGGDHHGELQTGDWEFAAFLQDGSRKPNVNFDKCRKCHLQAQRTDFTFSVYPNLDSIRR